MNTPVNFELAKLLKEKGYEEECKHYYEHALTESYHEHDGHSGPFGWEKDEINYQSGFHINNSNYDSSNTAWFLCSAPTIAEVVMWLYEKHDIWIWVRPYKDHGDDVNDPIQAQMNIWKDGFTISKEYNSPAEAYEAAIDSCLKELI